MSTEFASACDWDVELSLEDVGTSGYRRQADSFDSLDEEDILSDSTFVSDIQAEHETLSAPVHSKSMTCPCCKKAVVGDHRSLHTHVSRCFIGSKKKSSPSKQRGNERDRARNRIDSIRQNVSRMDLRQRISLMESLNRLAHTVSSRQDTDKSSSTTGMTRSDIDDHLTISLLYSSPKDKIGALKVECSSPTTVPCLPPRETCTPSLRAHVKDARSRSPINLHLESVSASPPSTRVLRKLKRKREVVQALSFAPTDDDFEGGMLKGGMFKFPRVEVHL